LENQEDGCRRENLRRRRLKLTAGVYSQRLFYWQRQFLKKKSPSTIARIYKLVGSWRILFGALIGATGTFIIFSPNIPQSNNWYIQNCPYFHAFSDGLEKLTNFQVEPSSPDYREGETSLKKGQPGFKEILKILNGTAPSKINKMSVIEITNRRDGTLKESSGEYIDVLNLVHVHDPNANPPYALITTESDLHLRIDLHRDRWIEGLGTAIALLGIFWPYLWQLFIVAGTFLKNLTTWIFEKLNRMIPKS